MDQFAIAMVGYGSNESQTAVIELKYNYNVTEYTEGDGYINVCDQSLYYSDELMIEFWN